MKAGVASLEEPILQEGVVIAGRYRVGRLLGKGGMGAVYEARHAELERSVAIKVLLPKFAQDGDVLARFFREARAAAAIRHPGIVEILDLGRHEGLAYIVMEKLEGEELAERIRFNGRLGPHFVAHFGAQLADAIAAAHESGVVHRDLKPQNVFLSKLAGGREAVKVLDFGIAKLIDAESGTAPLTRTGEVFGTPMYMAPEQLRAMKDVDARADVYAVGVILREALTGMPPFEANSLPDLMVKVVSEPIVPLDTLRPGLPTELVAVVSQAMARDREARFQTARALAQRLTAIAAMLPPDVAEPAAAGDSSRRPDSDTFQTPALAPTSPGRGVIEVIASLPPVPQALATQPPPATPRRRSVTPWVLASAAALIGAGVVGLVTAPRAASSQEQPDAAVEAQAPVLAPEMPAPSTPAVTPAPVATPVVEAAPVEPVLAPPRQPKKPSKRPAAAPEAQPELLQR